VKRIDSRGETQKKNAIGIVSAILSALLFGTSPVVAALAYAGGSNGMTMTFTRSLFSIPFLFLIAKAMKVSLRVRKRELITLFIVSVAGNFATTVMLYSSFQYIGIGLATVLHYLSPVIIMLINIVLFKEKAKSWKILSLILAFVGMLTFFSRSGGTLFLGTLLALGSAVSYAIIFLSVEHTTLNTQHHDVTDARQIFPLFFKCFRDGRRLVDDCLVRNEFSRQFTDRRGCSQPREPCGRLILVLFEVLNRFHNEHEIVQL
jgi:EamA domain-containing membrane protein RarD